MTMYPDYASIFSGIFQKVTQSFFPFKIIYETDLLIQVADSDKGCITQFFSSF